jgi:putative hydrolase of the HAD superfamily
MEIRAVSLDLFDTLVDLETGGGAAMQSALHSLHAALAEHLDLDLDAFLGELRALERESRERVVDQDVEVPTEKRFEQLVEHFGLDQPDLPEILTGIHMGVIRSCVKVPEHHAGVLRALRKRARVGLCSNFTHAATVYGILDEADFRTHLDAIAISVEVGFRKPRREIFERVLAGLSTQARHTLHVGDNLRSDVAGAAAFGMKTAWITRRVEDPEGLLAQHQGPQPDFVVADLRDLVELVEQAGPGLASPA